MASSKNAKIELYNLINSIVNNRERHKQCIKDIKKVIKSNNNYTRTNTHLLVNLECFSNDEIQQMLSIIKNDLNT